MIGCDTERNKMDIMEMNRNTETGAEESPENIFALSFQKGEESFPVLKAFQEFLDAERERARRRQMVLTLSFMSAIVVLVVLFCVIGAILFSGTARRNDAKQDKLLEMLLAERKAPIPVPGGELARPRHDAVVAEVMELVKQLKAETEALKVAMQRPPETAPISEVVPVASVPQADPIEVSPEQPLKRTGVFSSPKRKPETVTPIEEKSDRVAEPAPADVDAVDAVEPEKGTELAQGEADADGMVQVKIIPSRVMHPPAGYDAEEIAIVTEGNVRYPWRVLVPAVPVSQVEEE